MSLPSISNLIFATRAEPPQLGSEFNREVVAESPGIPDDARALFGRCADITLKARKNEKLEIFIFRRVRQDLWLFSRAVSLGLYRKGSHQLLVHGLLLKRAHLDAVEGNPFLLGRAGIFSEQHPGENRRLAAIELPDSIAAKARPSNLARFDELAGELDRDADFARSYDGLVRGRAVSRQIPRPKVDWVEWMLLHLHPHDRAETSFHTWAVDDTAEDYRLSLAPESEGHRRRTKSSEAASPLARASERFRREKGPADYLEALDTYLLTYHSKRDAIPLKGDQALLAFRKAVGKTLDPKQEEVVEDLFLRGLRRPARAATVLGDFWEKSGFERFSGRFEKLARKYPEVVADQLGELRSLLGGDLRRIWTALELVRRRRSSEIDEQRLLALWRALVPSERCEELLELFPDRAAVDRVQDALKIYIGRSVERHLASDEGAATSLKKMPYWSVWEDWTARHGAPLTATVGTMEDLVAQHSPDPGVAAGRYRELAELAHHRGEPVFGYRLTFQRELPELARVGSGAQRQRLEELILRLVGSGFSGDEVDSKLKALRFFLSRPPRELLESGGADGRALLSTVLLALIFRARSEDSSPVVEALQRLDLSEASDLPRLLRAGADHHARSQDWVTADDWAEQLFDDLLRAREQPDSAPVSALRWTYEACLRLTWWLWAREGYISDNSDLGFAEPRLMRLFDMGIRLGEDSSRMLEVIEGSVPLERLPAAVDLFERLRTVYGPGAIAA